MRTGDTGAMRTFARVLPAIGLFFLAPLVAEFLLGDFPITMIAIVLILAPLYGGGAVLIREIARRTGRGWPTILTLALAYGILEEAFTTQTLFNPNYLGLHLHLLDHAFIPALGIGGWWTIFVLTLHTVWSISVPIALVESLVPARAERPWLGRIGLGAVSVLFALAAVAMTLNAIRQDRNHFVASHAQFLTAGFLCLTIAAAAFFLPVRIATKRSGKPASPWICGALVLAAGSIFLIVPPAWGWGAVAVFVPLDLAVGAAVVAWSGMKGWNQQHILALAGGAALAYAWHAFLQKPVMGRADAVTRIGNAILALATILLLAIAARKTSPTRGNLTVSGAQAE